jgi:hypothetical protein
VAEWPIASVLKSIFAGSKLPSKSLETACFQAIFHFLANNRKLAKTGRKWRLRLSRQPGLGSPKNGLARLSDGSPSMRNAILHGVFEVGATTPWVNHSA